MRLIWVRHGETLENGQGKYLGHSDTPLAENGIAQAYRLARRLSRAIQPPAAIYTSDLRRCRQTAEVIARQWAMKPQIAPALRELSFGDWELLTYGQLMQTDPERATRWYDDPFSHKPPNGESLRELGQRVDAWLGSLQAASSSGEPKTIVLVSHGGVIRWFQAAWLEQEPGRYWQVEGLKHGEATLVVWNGERWQRALLQNGCEGL